MKIALDKAVSVAVAYLGEEVEKIPNRATRFATMFAIGAMGANPQSFAEKGKVLGIVDDDGLVDTDSARAGFSMAFANGNCLDALGLKFTASDGEELLRRMES